MDDADNLIFAVNGNSKERFKIALELAMNGQKAEGYRIDPKMGVILYWYIDSNKDKKVNAFLQKSTPNELVEQLYSWVMDNDVRNVIHLPNETEKTEQEYLLRWTHQTGGVDNEKGWIIYKNSWGCVDDGWGKNDYHDSHTICAIAPAWLWIGK